MFLTAATIVIGQLFNIFNDYVSTPKHNIYFSEMIAPELPVPTGSFGAMISEKYIVIICLL